MAEQRDSNHLKSLGWIAQSSAQPRKRKDIGGLVTHASMIELKAQVYEGQEKARQAQGESAKREREHQKTLKERRRRRLSATYKREEDILGSDKNRGVEERNRLDRQNMNLARASPSHMDSYSALERKADLYNKLARGEVEDRDEAYDVDFVKKKAKSNPHEEHAVGETVKALGYPSDNGGAPAPSSSPSFLPSSSCSPARTEVLPGFCPSRNDKPTSKSIIKDVASRTLLEREKVAALKEKRKLVKHQKRNKLKAAYLAQLKRKHKTA